MPTTTEKPILGSSPLSSRFQVNVVGAHPITPLQHSSSFPEESLTFGPLRPKRTILRSSSVGSWYGASRNGRFSVSPVPDTDSSVSVNVYNFPTSLTCSFTYQAGTSPAQGTIELLIGKQGVNIAEDVEAPAKADENENERTPSSEVAKLKKRISFIVPETHSDVRQPTYAERYAKNRRMSTPILSACKAVARPKPKLPSLKMCQNLDSLDLRSSVPLSPTRLSGLLGKTFLCCPLVTRILNEMPRAF